MTPPTQHREPTIARLDSSYVWWRGHCGSCDWCTQEREAWCPSWVTPIPGSDRWSEPFRVAHLDDASARAIACTAVVLDLVDAWHEDDPTVLVVGAREDSSDVVTLLEHAGVHAVAEPRVIGTRLSERSRADLAIASASGRADLAVTFDGGLATCARWVRRSGAVASVVTSDPEPDLDALTMRELTVLSPRRAHVWVESLAVR